jgi:hypothetical protein
VPALPLPTATDGALPAALPLPTASTLVDFFLHPAAPSAATNANPMVNRIGPTLPRVHHVSYSQCHASAG